jgi:hypothetical protein
MRIVMAGGTGFLGSALVDSLRRDGYAVTVLTRKVRRSNQIAWDPYGSITSWAHVMDGADAVINLTGAPINRRWTAAHKRDMWNSRVRTTRTVVTAMKSVRHIPPVLLNGSAVGIYGPHGDEPLTEESRPGAGFLAGLGEAWEKEALAAGPQARVVLLRTAIALAGSGGALPPLALPFRFFVGGPVGSGTQYLPWIHRDDWVAMVRWALLNNITGPLNVASPNPVTNAEFAHTLGKALHRPACFPAPAFAVRLVLGEMADAILTGQRVVPDKARQLGFDFNYPTLESALRAIYAS